MAVWVPRFACPECRAEIDSRLRCLACGASFERHDDLFQFLSSQRARAVEPFQQQYRTVREREGYRRPSPDFYRMLPSVSRGDCQAGEWRIRSESYAHLLQHAVPDGHRAPLRILDLGAGNGWLSHRLAACGHSVVAVDRLDDETDGLGACRHYAVPIVAVQADFDALPFEPSQFDLVVFNSSLHYSADPAATLAHAGRMLTPSGVIAVMDSPMFANEADGEAMVTDQSRRIEIDHGVHGVIRPGIGFVTFAGLERITGSLGLQGRFFRTHGPIGWRLRRRLARLKLGRPPAAFGVWVAR